MKEKSYVEDIDRSVYDFKDDEKDAYKLQAGLTPEIVEKLSKEKNDPVWMQNFWKQRDRMEGNGCARSPVIPETCGDR